MGARLVESIVNADKLSSKCPCKPKGYVPSTVWHKSCKSCTNYSFARGFSQDIENDRENNTEVMHKDSFPLQASMVVVRIIARGMNDW